MRTVTTMRELRPNDLEVRHAGLLTRQRLTRYALVARSWDSMVLGLQDQCVPMALERLWVHLLYTRVHRLAATVSIGV